MTKIETSKIVGKIKFKYEEGPPLEPEEHGLGAWLENARESRRRAMRCQYGPSCAERCGERATHAVVAKRGGERVGVACALHARAVVRESTGVKVRPLGRER
jgi:hypothetical protein